MKKCAKCGTVWDGYGQPRPRQICDRCGAYLHSCVNCHHFDRQRTNSCTLPETTFIGSRDASNYCEQYRMVDWALRAIESRTEKAKLTWENLFRR